MSRSPFRRSTQQSLANAVSTWHDRAAEGGVQKQREKSRVLDEAYEEYCRLREAGEVVLPSQFCERYPTYRHSLRRLIDVHDNLEQMTDLDQESWPEPGAEFMGFQILHELGVGAIARVFLASELALGGRYVVLKVSLYGGDEADTLGKLSHHNVVPVHSVQFDPATGMTAVCMPYLGSATLADVLDRAFTDAGPPERAAVILQAAHDHERFLAFVDRGYLATEEDGLPGGGSYVDGVVWLGIELANALAYTHSQGILHRDLKPSNVLLTPHARPMLLDFNLSCDIRLDVGRVGGTLPYMPPEQIREVHQRTENQQFSNDPRSDIFAMGVILYELLSGRLPFGDPPSGIDPQEAAKVYLEMQRREPAPLNQLNPQVDAQLTQLIQRCLAPDPDDRPTTAAELAQLLRRRFALPRRLGRWAKCHARILTAVALLLTAATVLGGLYLRSLPPYAERQCRAGIAALEREQYEDAIRYCDRALAVDPSLWPALFARGIAYQRANNLPRSIDDLQAAANSTSLAILYESLGDSYLAAGRGEAAAGAFSKAVMSDPQSPRCQLKCAYAMMRARYPADGALESLLSVAPAFQRALHLRAFIRLNLAQQGKVGIETVLQDLEAALASGPSYASLEYDAAVACALAIPQRPELRDRLHAHLENAVAQGWPPSELVKESRFESIRSEPWFRQLVTRPRSSTPSESRPQTFAPPAPLDEVFVALQDAVSGRSK